ncbi:MAG: 4-(cytidine 5'-diphospho)-2-C-methyl-D-erythritol kinase [Dehalococcoidia bacterium]
MTLHLLAPAKLNLTLEVLGKRDDGYHEVSSIMQTIDLCDRVRLSLASDLQLIVTGPEASGVPEEPAQDLAYRAAVALQKTAGISLGARIEVEKQIPAGAGLGGGSSDAAAVLRGLYELWDVEVSFSEFVELAATLGSDVPFFLDGGTQAVGGRGEELTPLPDAAGPRDFTLFTSPLTVPDKTRRMYGALRLADFSDGERTAMMTAAVWRGEPVSELCNAFDHAVAEVFPAIGAAMQRCRNAAVHVIAAGAGRSFFAPVAFDLVPPKLVQSLLADYGITAHTCSALSSADALAVTED